MRRRLRPAFLLLLLLVATVAVSVACSGEGAVPGGAPTVGQATPVIETQNDTTVVVYRSPTCSCCREYEAYLEDNGFHVDAVELDDLTDVKDDLQIPEGMQSCHTAVTANYFIEGHVPVEAVQELLSERPPIDGIALPGMPPGSPGMGGDKEGSFVIYAITDGQAEEFMTI